MATIQFKYGLSTSPNWPNLNLATGEPAFLTDTGKLYIGDGTQKVLINPTYGTAAPLNVGLDEGEIPVLGTGGKLDPSVIPATFVNNVYVVATVADLITLTDAQVGDIAVVTGAEETYALQSLPATTQSNWVKLLFNDAVLSVNGMSGVVVVAGKDILLTGYTGTETGVIAATDTVNAAIAKLNNKFGDYLSLTSGGTVAGNVDFQGTTTVVTQPAGTNNTTVATTAFVKDAVDTAIGSIDYPVDSVNGQTGDVVLDGADILATGYTIATSASAIAPTDTINDALGKLEYGINNISGGSF